ncbi:MAG: FAD-dependent thymidylate synthase [Methanomassiliicoccales archaeon]
MKVRLLSYTQQAEVVCATAAKACYSQKTPSDIMDHLEQEKAGQTIDKVVGMGHHSVIEHASYTFSLEGVSRAMTHQLVRHRLASFSQQSQRYVSMLKADYVMPASIRSDPALAKEFEEAMDKAWDIYRKLAEKVPAEDARYVLPNACCTNIMVTMNARELMHFFTLRCCNRAQAEIREAAELMLVEVQKVSPQIFRDAGPACVRGPCSEGELTCGKPRRRKKE